VKKDGSPVPQNLPVTLFRNPPWLSSPANPVCKEACPSALSLPALKLSSPVFLGFWLGFFSPIFGVQFLQLKKPLFPCGSAQTHSFGRLLFSVAVLIIKESSVIPSPESVRTLSLGLEMLLASSSGLLAAISTLQHSNKSYQETKEVARPGQKYS